ncbi:alcohol oxidase [Mycena rosella]|uniref:Alcohol oxidase n=1 Tax=Mycena rosella TaxID=1033263 RepID=A0AAD7GHG1_MYCRO|nr:alcohol oxidase [Mycena rosella]
MYDYILVGGGTAGCVLAARLSEDPAVSVLVLERGRVHDAWYARIPLISSDVTSKATPIVRSPSIPITGAEGQVVDIVHAEVLGGGSAVNAMLVTRGAVGDFEHWAALGHPEWGYTSLRPYFIKSEKSLSQRSGDRGYSGPWVNQTFPDYPYKVQSSVKAAALALGFADVGDLNAANVPVDAFATLDAAIDGKMRRMSTYHAFLPAEITNARRNRLSVCIKAVATRIMVEGGVAVGVEFESSDKSVPGAFYARARREIVVCCGAIGSPQLLLLSGIGAAEHLGEHGIETVSDLPGVGQHLQDHIGLPLMYEVPLEDTLHYIENNMWAGALELGKYFLGRKSIMGVPVTLIAMFAHSSHLDEETAAVSNTNAAPSEATGDNRPDLEIMPIAHWCSEPPPYKIKMGVFSFLLCNVQPKSRGSVRLASRDPHLRPTVDLGFLSNAEDFVPLRKGIRLALRLAEAMRADGYPMKDFQVPSSEAESDLDAFIRTHLRNVFHYTSSCRMARREEGGVVDDDLRVYGVRGLRVCDASIFPCVTSGHTMTPVIAIAERCADLMKKGC